MVIILGYSETFMKNTRATNILSSLRKQVTDILPLFHSMHYQPLVRVEALSRFSTFTRRESFTRIEWWGLADSFLVGRAKLSKTRIFPTNSLKVSGPIFGVKSQVTAKTDVT